MDLSLDEMVCKRGCRGVYTKRMSRGEGFDMTPEESRKLEELMGGRQKDLEEWIEAKVKEEREACARLCCQMASRWAPSLAGSIMGSAIRARGDG